MNATTNKPLEEQSDEKPPRKKVKEEADELMKSIRKAPLPKLPTKDERKGEASASESACTKKAASTSQASASSVEIATRACADHTGRRCKHGKIDAVAWAHSQRSSNGYQCAGQGQELIKVHEVNVRRGRGREMTRGLSVHDEGSARGRRRGAQSSLTLPRTHQRAKSTL